MDNNYYQLRLFSEILSQLFLYAKKSINSVRKTGLCLFDERTEKREIKNVHFWL